MTLLIKYWKPLVVLLLLAGAFFWGYRSRQDEVDKLKGVVLNLERVVSDLSQALKVERAATLERAERLRVSEEGHEELSKALDILGLRDDWAVPDALYERLRCPAPSRP